MKRLFPIVLLSISIAGFSGCKSQASAPAAAPARITDLAQLAAAVPNTGPRTGNNYKVFIKVLRDTSQSPAVGFKVDAWVKGKSEPKTLVTDADGIVKFEDLPFPESTNHLMAVVHYYRGKDDRSRDINYPYVESDAYRLKDTQDIPNAANADPQ